MYPIITSIYNTDLTGTARIWPGDARFEAIIDEIRPEMERLEIKVEGIGGSGSRIDLIEIGRDGVCVRTGGGDRLCGPSNWHTVLPCEPRGTDHIR